ncbi:MAG: aspartate--tRNA ligase [Ruminococcus sp.]|nr:aspartate--tRNA ligase [Ruminococcus sp.]MBQ7028520.1 aspartate--tRNA ligase [Ruminococcus sp.]
MYRTLYCNDISESHVGQRVQLAGWVDVIRDHGGVIFVDIRDYTGITQTVIHDEEMVKNVNRETVISVSGIVRKRDEDTVNTKIATGYVELVVDELTVLGKSKNMLPFDVRGSRLIKDELRLKYRYLDLRNPKNHENLLMRSRIIRHLRNKMESKDFLEMQTPILTASSPEGARDFLVPSRKHPGKFYALPQAPQQFKQLLMVSGFDKYFQIAPCFRDEDARADRSPGEFYQLDFEMAFATQEEVLEICEDVIYDTFKTFSDKKITEKPFRRITYADAMMTYGSDKPDLRNPLVICDLTDFFAGVSFPAFRGKPVRGIVADCQGKSNKFFENSLKYATSDEVALGGLGYITLKDGVFIGPIAKFLSDEQKSEIITLSGVKEGETLFFICDEKKNDAEKKAGLIRTWLAKKEQLDLIRDDSFEFCFVVDFPMYEIDEETGETIFTHNPFSMPQGGMDSLLNKKPTEVLAYQYDLVCNGIELASGAVRNHDIDIMKKAFEIAGYGEDELKKRFSALYNAFQYGAPPHAGMAPGIDRMVMLLTDEEKILEVIAFPLNGNAQDLLLGAPSEVTNQQLEDVHLLGSTSVLGQRTASTGSGAGSSSYGKRSTFSNAQQLNQLSLTDEEEAVMQEIFNSMKGAEEELSKCDTENVEAMVHVMPMTNVLREDVRKQPFTRESLLEGAPARSDDSWQVPRLVK